MLLNGTRLRSCCENEPRAGRVSSPVFRRGYNIDSLTRAEVDHTGSPEPHHDSYTSGTTAGHRTISELVDCTVHEVNDLRGEVARDSKRDFASVQGQRHGENGSKPAGLRNLVVQLGGCSTLGKRSFSSITPRRRRKFDGLRPGGLLMRPLGCICRGGPVVAPVLAQINARIGAVI